MEIDYEALSPMMRHYMDTKKDYPDCILFYRLGDFYEMFFDDALAASKALEITLTGKDCGLKERAPMCGVPYHAVDTYLLRLVQKGYKVAIAEQVEDPKLAKGLVKREVIRVVTPGTITSTNALDETKNNYLMSIYYVAEDKIGLAVSDATTGDFYVTELGSFAVLLDEIYRFAPAELICNQGFEKSPHSLEAVKEKLNFTISYMDSWFYEKESGEKIIKEQYHIGTLAGLGLEDYPDGTIAASALLKYLKETQKTELIHFTTITPYTTGRYMILDTSTRRNLELTETLREKQKRGSLLWVLDKTGTAMGARMLRTYIEQPLIDADAILMRQDAICAMLDHYIDREELREYLVPIYDLERLMGRISLGTANPRDLIAFKNSVGMLPGIKQVLSSLEADSVLLKHLNADIDPMTDLYDLIEKSIVDEPPIAIKEGGIIKDGYHEQADILRRARTEGKQWIAELEEVERNRTGIPKMKVGFNKVFGYYIEVTNSYKSMVPEDYMRKQTLTNGERYITPKLKELEETILGAEEKLNALEYELYTEVRDKIATEIERIQRCAKAIASLDAFASLALVAERNHYVRPSINQEGIIEITDGRHPVVEKMIKDDMFVSNDVYLDQKNNRCLIITGPNMAGKSTYMRQVALITLMAQIGSFVPASSANIGICDRIFTRVGASDDLASGQSTFMVEMTEVSNILRNATKNSLLVLDEIGRGTSTFDGLSIAWAVIEHISNANILGAKTLFATHYHELTELEGTMEGVTNFCIAVKECGDDIVFLRKIVPGGADKSYGIQVAKLAGVPDCIIDRSKELLDQLLNADVANHAQSVVVSAVNDENRVKTAPSIEESKRIKNGLRLAKEIEQLDLNRITPLEAINVLYTLQGILDE